MSEGRERGDDSSLRGVLRFRNLDVQLPTTFQFKYLSLSDERNKTCKFCSAKMWKEESIFCCGHGKYVVHRLKPLPPGVLNAFSSPEFFRNQRRYNNLFSFTCLGASPGKAWVTMKGPSMMKLHGRPYHRIMDSFKNSYNNTVTNNARMYIYDHELQNTGRSLHLDGETVIFIAQQLRQHNSWVKQYRALLLEIDNSDEDNMSISFQQSSRVTPTARTEIAALLYKDNSDEPGKRHVYTYPRNGPAKECDKPRFVPIYTSSYLPLQYPLLYFSGDSGCSPGDILENRQDRTLSTTGNVVDACFYARQRLMIEPVFHRLSTVAQEWACDQYARTDDLKLSYIEKQLPKKRLTTKNAIHNAPPQQKVGKRLPASFHGSHINRKRKQLDAMAVVARLGAPTLMVTFTANPSWPEVTENLLPGQTGMDRPDLISRVFKVKLKHLLADLRQGLFGRAQYIMHVIEWQGRGLVHAHIIVMYPDGPEEEGKVDDWIWTNLPDSSIAGGKLREKVLAYHIHKKCGKHCPSAPCMKVDPKTKYEVVMSSKYSPEALHSTLQDLCQNDLPFGGKTILFSGDWRQVAPVLKYGTEAEIVEQAFLSSYLWKHVERFRLTKSTRNKDDLPYAQTVLAIGEGKVEPVQLKDGSVALPLKHTITNDDGSQTVCSVDGTTNFEDLIHKVYPELLDVDHSTYNDRAILAATNDNVDTINNFILDKMHGRIHHQLSSDKIVTDDDNMPDVVSVEYLNRIDVAGTPPHDLSLKIGALVFFIRNINFDNGLVNGKRGIIRGVSRRIIDVEVICDGSPIVKISRICFEIKVGSRGITFHRYQFPVRLCYAMSINKAQGQTLQQVGLDLRGDVFCHGQLYVALSRTTCRDNILCLVHPDRFIDNVPHVHNVVYSDFIIAATGQPPPTFALHLSARGKILDTENTQQIDTNDSSNSSDSRTNPSDSENDQDNNKRRQ